MTDPRQDPTSGPGKPRVLSYRLPCFPSLPASALTRSLSSKETCEVHGAGLSNANCSLKLFGDKADFKFSPFYGKGLIEVRQLQVSQLVSGRACKAKIY